MKPSHALTVLVLAIACAMPVPAGPLAHLQAWQTGPASSTDLLLKAKTVAIVGKTGTQMMDRGWANPNGDRGREKVAAILTTWGRYQIVDDPVAADLILVVLESQKNLNLFKRANLIAELKVYPGGDPLTEQTPVLWSGEAGESFRKLPSTQVAEKFTDFVNKLEHPAAGKK